MIFKKCDEFWSAIRETEENGVQSVLFPTVFSKVAPGLILERVDSDRKLWLISRGIRFSTRNTNTPLFVLLDKNLTFITSFFLDSAGHQGLGSQWHHHLMDLFRAETLHLCRWLYFTWIFMQLNYYYFLIIKMEKRMFSIPSRLLPQ